MLFSQMKVCEMKFWKKYLTNQHKKQKINKKVLPTIKDLPKTT